jgi:CDP-6-deoxy-D-xylo-4-hexulose-3-dehydrase
MTDLQAAIGCAQLAKLPAFIEARNRNWQLLRQGLDNLSDYFILPEPAPNSKPSWFGFLLTLKENANFCRNEIVKFMESEGVQTRMLFSGNIARHPCFDEPDSSDAIFRIVGDLNNTYRVMGQSFWIGVYPGMTDEMVSHMIKLLENFSILHFK